jgi:mevalonate kinase
MEVSGYTFVVEKALYEQAAPISINMTPMGFSVDSNLELGGGCGSSCSGGSCSTGQ